MASIPSTTSSYDANDRMASLTYDNNGNILSADGISYSYDYANRITGTSTGVSIQYTGDGVRVSETVAGITTQYRVDEHNPTGYAQVVEEIRNGQIQTRYTYGRDLISQTMVGAGATSFYSDDGLGSVRALTNGAGAVTDRYTYDAFGTTLATTGSTTNAYRFTGEQQDAALGMYYLRARYYQAGSGRFWTRDSWEGCLRYPDSLHKYLYTQNNPVTFIDPSGHMMIERTMSSSKLLLPAIPWVKVTGLAIACVLAIDVSLFTIVLQGDTLEGINWLTCNASSRKQKWTCTGQCNVENYKNVPNAPARTYGTGYGSTESEACRAAKDDAQSKSPAGTYTRHCYCPKCVKQ